MEVFDSNYFLVTLLRFKDCPRDREWIVPGTNVSIACIALNNLLNGSFYLTQIFLSKTKGNHQALFYRFICLENESKITQK